MKFLQKTNFLSNAIGVLGLIFAAILIFNFAELFALLVDFSEKYFSPDNQINPGGVYNVKMVFVTSILFIILLSIIFLLNLNILGKTYNFLNSFIDIESLKRFLFDDELCNKKKLSRNIFIAGTSLAILVHLYVLTFGDPTWEGEMEEFFSLIFFFTAVLLIVSIFSFPKNLFSPETRKKIIFLLIGIAGILLFIYGEEISWGQRLFGIDSPEFFDEYNTQAETNFHNFFNPLFLFVYPTVGISSFLILCLIWFFPYKKKPYLFALFIPHPSLFSLVFIMACTSFLGETEIYEEAVAIFAFLYSIRIFMCLRFPNVDSIAMKEKNS